MKQNIFVLTLLVSLFFASTLSFSVINVNAQTQATVTMLGSLGGTTTPDVGTQTYNDGATVTLTANTQSTFTFVQWIISNDTNAVIDNNNPATFTVQAGDNYTVQPIFAPVQTSQLGNTPTTNPADGRIVILASVGGTTNPAPGYYAVSSLKQTTLTAIPVSGWQFSHWIISGYPMTSSPHGDYPFTATPTDNPYTVGHGEGNQYNYQAVFTPIGSTEPTPTATATPTTVMGISTDTAIIAVLAVIIVVLVIALGLVAMRKRKQ